MARLTAQLDEFWHFLETVGPGSRIFIGTYMFVTGAARIVTGNTPAMISVFSSRVYGLLMVLCATALILTARKRYRCYWAGRLSAIACAAIWLLIIAVSWPAHAWVSISGAIVFIIGLVNEVRIHER